MAKDNLHHFNYDRASHEANPYNKRVRRSMGMIARLSTDVHIELHKNCPPVPVLGHYTASAVASAYVPHHNPLVGQENYLRALSEVQRRPKVHPIEKDLIDLIAEAHLLQRPYIIEGLILDDRGTHYA